MAIKETTTYQYTCDLCGEVRAEGGHSAGRGKLHRLYGDQHTPVDICGECMSKPVSALFGFLAGEPQRQREAQERRDIELLTRDEAGG